MCDRLWSEEAMAELEKLLVDHIGKYLQPTYEVVNIFREGLTPT